MERAERSARAEATQCALLKRSSASSFIKRKDVSTNESFPLHFHPKFCSDFSIIRIELKIQVFLTLFFKHMIFFHTSTKERYRLDEKKAIS
jgi:hypothetical protein